MIYITLKLTLHGKGLTLLMLINYAICTTINLKKTLHYFEVWAFWYLYEISEINEII